MSSKENSQKARVKTRRFTVSGKYDNARGFRNGVESVNIENGDSVSVQVGAQPYNGDVVLVRCSKNCSDSQTTPHYHAQYFKTCNGHKYKFTLNVWMNRGGTRHIEGEEKRIIGRVVRVYKKGGQPATKRKGQSKLNTYTVIFDWSYFGVHRGDELTVEENGKVKIGNLALIWEKDRSDSYFARVCDVKESSVRVSGDAPGCDSYDVEHSRIVGAAIGINHAVCVVTKIHHASQPDSDSSERRRCMVEHHADCRN